jgi:hypothetical protein
LATWILSEATIREADLPLLTDSEREALVARIAREICTAILVRMQDAPQCRPTNRDTIPN